jgi:hypothetical protein
MVPWKEKWSFYNLLLQLNLFRHSTVRTDTTGRCNVEFATRKQVSSVLALTPATSMAQHPDLWAWGTKHSAMLVTRCGSTKLQTAEA